MPQRPHRNKCLLPTLIICAAWEWPLLLTTRSVHLTADLRGPPGGLRLKRLFSRLPEEWNLLSNLGRKQAPLKEGLRNTSHAGAHKGLGTFTNLQTSFGLLALNVVSSAPVGTLLKGAPWLIVWTYWLWDKMCFVCLLKCVPGLKW